MSNNEDRGLLGWLGLSAGIGAAGIAVKNVASETAGSLDAIKHRKETKEARARKFGTNESSVKPYVPSDIVSPADAKLYGFRSGAQSGVMDILPEGMETIFKKSWEKNGALSFEHQQYLDDVMQWTKDLMKQGKKVKFSGTMENGKLVKINMSMLGERTIKFGRIAENGVITTRNTGARYAFVPQVMTPAGTGKVAAHTVSQPFGEFLNENVLDYNTANIRMLRQAYESGQNVREVESIFSSMVQYDETNMGRGPLAEAVTGRIVPLTVGEHGVQKLDLYSGNTLRDYVNNMIEYAEDYGGTPIDTGIKLESDLKEGTLFDPRRRPGYINELGEGHDKAFQQLVNKSSLVFDEDLMPHSIDTRFYEDGGSNIISVGTWMNNPAASQTALEKAGISATDDIKNFNLLNEMARSGYGNKGYHLPALQSEGAYISRRLANKMSFDMRAVEVLTDSAYDVKGMEGIFDGLSLYYLYNKDKSTGSILSNKAIQVRQQLGDNIEQAREKIGSSYDDWRSQRHQLMQEIFGKQKEDEFFVKDLIAQNKDGRMGMRYKGDIAHSTSGAIGLGKYGPEEIIDIQTGGSKNGYLFKTAVSNKFEDWMKVWGDMKLTVTGVLEDADDMAFKLFAFDDMIKRAENPAEKIKAISGALNKYRIMDTRAEGELELNSLLKDYEPKRKFFREGVTDMFTNQPIRSTKSADGKLVSDALHTLSKGETEFRVAETMQQVGFDEEIYDSSLSVFADADGNLPKQSGFAYNIFSVDKNGKLRGMDSTKSSTINPILLNKMKNQGFNEFADELSGQLKFSEMKEAFETMAPMYTNQANKGWNIIPEKDFIKFSPDAVARIMEGGDDAQAMIHGELQRVTGKKLQSNSTKYLIQWNKKITDGQLETRYTPLTLPNSSGYVGIVNDLGIEGQEPIRKALSRSMNRFYQAKLSGAGEEIVSDAFASVVETSNHMVQKVSNYSKVQVNEAFLSEVQPGQTLSPEYLKNILESSQDKSGVMDIYRKYGINPDNLDSAEDLIGFSDKTFWNAAERTDMYRDRLAEFKNKFMTDNNLDSLSPEMSNRMLSEFRAQNMHSMINDGLVGAFIRDPGYTGESGALGKITNAEALQRDIYKHVYGMSEKQASEMAKHMIRNNKAYTSAKKMAQLGLDLDSDMLKSIIAKTESVRETSLKHLAQDSPDFARTYAAKGSLKADSASDLRIGDVGMKARMEKALAEGYSIGPLYTSSQAYMTELNPELVNLIGEQKAKGISHFLATLPEQGIGGKGGMDRGQIDSILDIFNHKKNSSISIEDRAKRLHSMLTTDERFIINSGDNVGKNWFESIGLSLDDTSKVIRSGDALKNSDSYKIFNRLTSNFQDSKWVQEIFKRMESTSGTKTAGVVSEMFEAIKDGMPTQGNGFRKGINATQDVFENAFQKTIKSKAFLGLAGAAVLTGLLLKPADSNVQTQEAREEARPKRKPPRAAEAIDPNSSRVIKDAPRGYNMELRGRLPRGITPSQFSSGIMQRGVNPTGSINNRDSSVDSQYMKSLQNEEKYNKWQG